MYNADKGSDRGSFLACWATCDDQRSGDTDRGARNKVPSEKALSLHLETMAWKDLPPLCTCNICGCIQGVELDGCAYVFGGTLPCGITMCQSAAWKDLPACPPLRGALQKDRLPWQKHTDRLVLDELVLSGLGSQATRRDISAPGTSNR